MDWPVNGAQCALSFSAADQTNLSVDTALGSRKQYSISDEVRKIIIDRFGKDDLN